MRLDLFSLNLFADIVEARSIGAGAKQHHLAISAASKRMAELEDQFGLQLLTRHARGVQATDAGEALHRRVRQTLGDLEQIVVEMSEYAQGGRGRVRLFCTTIAMAHCLPEDLVSFANQHPDIALDIQESSPNETLEAVARGIADVGIVAPVCAYPADFKYWRYHTVNCVLVVPPDHALAHRSSVPFRETLEYPYIGQPVGSAWDLFMVSRAAACGLPLKVRLRANGYESACRMAEAGLGQAGAPEQTAQLHVQAGASLRIVRVEEPWSRIQLSVCCRDLKSVSVASRLLVRHLAQSPDMNGGAPLQG